MLFNHQRVLSLFLAGLFGLFSNNISAAPDTKDNPKGIKKHTKKKKNKETKKQSDLGPEFVIGSEVQLPQIPDLMISENRKFVTHIIFLSRKGLKPLMQHIFPAYETIEKEMAELLEEFKKDYQKLNDEATRQKLSVLMETKQRIARTEETLASRACQELNKALDEAAKARGVPVFFNIQLTTEESMPDYAPFPEVKGFIESLEKYVEYKFKKIYNSVLRQGVDN